MKLINLSLSLMLYGILSTSYAEVCFPVPAWDGDKQSSGEMCMSDKVIESWQQTVIPLESA